MKEDCSHTVGAGLCVAARGVPMGLCSAWTSADAAAMGTELLGGLQGSAPLGTFLNPMPSCLEQQDEG